MGSNFAIHALRPHAEAQAQAIDRVQVQGLDYSGDSIFLEFFVKPGGNVLLPEIADPERRDGLWKSTCFELFVQPQGADHYFEFNFSPSCDWAAYRFDGYREGMQNLPVKWDPEIVVFDVARDWFILSAEIDRSFLDAERVRIGLSAVIVEKGGRMSYWALNHPPGKPDFHHPDCFALELPAPGAS